MVKEVVVQATPNSLYREALEAAQKEYDELQARRVEIDARLARLRETLVSLSYLVSEDGPTESLTVGGLGLTEAVAKVLRLSGMALSPSNIRDELSRLGFNIKRYNSVVSSISKVLERLVKKGHVDVGISGNKRLYIWSPMQPGAFAWSEDVENVEDLTEKVKEVFG